jgi:hypothetical protein
VPFTPLANRGAKLEDYLQRLDKSDATERPTGGSRVKNLAEKIDGLDVLVEKGLCRPVPLL